MLGWIDKEYLYSYVYDYIGTTDVSRNSAKVSTVFPGHIFWLGLIL